jgi:hypothetical protein
MRLTCSAQLLLCKKLHVVHLLLLHHVAQHSQSSLTLLGSCTCTHSSNFKPLHLLLPAVVPVDPTLLVDNLGLSEDTVRALKARGIAALFPIQRQVLQPAMEGTDLIGRAKTGSGKTLAFALPVVESLIAEDKARGSRKAPGRPPRCVCLRSRSCLGMAVHDVCRQWLRCCACTVMLCSRGWRWAGQLGVCGACFARG